MKEVVIKFKPFLFNQAVFIRDEDGNITEEAVPQKSLAEYISLISNVNKIHFFGNEKFAEKIKNEFLTKYSNNNTIEFLFNK